MTYKLIFSRGKYGYYTNIFFKDYKEEIKYFKSYATSMNFGDDKDSENFFLEEGWFKSHEDAITIINLLNKNIDSVVVRTGDSYLVFSKEDFPEWEKSIL